MFCCGGLTRILSELWVDLEFEIDLSMWIEKDLHNKCGFTPPVASEQRADRGATITQLTSLTKLISAGDKLQPVLVRNNIVVLTVFLHCKVLKCQVEK